MKKPIFVIIGVFCLFAVGLIGFFSLLLGGIFVATNGAVTAADTMLVSAADADLPTFRQHLAVQYSNSLTDEQLHELMNEYRLAEFKSVFWNNRSIKNNNAELVGNLAVADGVKIPVKLNLIFEQGLWKVSSISSMNTINTIESIPVAVTNEDNETASPESLMENNNVAEVEQSNASDPSKLPNQIANSTTSDDKTTTGANTLVSLQDLPGESEAVELVKNWTSLFCQGVAKDDLSDFYSQTADKFQSKFTLEQFTSVFQKFLDQDVDLAWVAEIKPEFKRPPMMDNEGNISLDGFFPAAPFVNFEFRFSKQDEQWKPLHVDIEVEGAASGLPSFDFIKNLVIEKTLSFGNAVHEQDFSDFHHEQLAKQFREKYPVAKFAAIFKDFLNERANLKWIEGIDPVFDTAPTLNTDGILQAIGSFPSKPMVNFRYAFVQEDAIWKMIMININVPPEDESTDEANAATQTERLK